MTFTIARRRGRPTDAEKAAQSEFKARWAARQERLRVHHERELALARDFAELDHGGHATIWDWDAAYNALEADRMRIIRAPL